MRPAADLFAGLDRKGGPVVGLGAFVAVLEAVGDRVDVRTERAVAVANGKRAAASPVATLAAQAKRLTRTDASALARVLAAVGSVHRLRIVSGLLEGPATYRWLRKRTRLDAGPLYHHINQLRLAGLIGPKERDLYELTRGGRNLLLALLAARRLIADPRLRPAP
jgi:DNA-binding HxlR family transcriptional regulator